MTIFEELQQRGLVKQITNEEKIAQKLNGLSQFFYIGFDPTADSLHIGHLLQLIFARRLAEKGHIPLMLIGGATAKVGDPTGKTEMRPMLTDIQLSKNIDGIKTQISSIMNGLTHIVVNNADWMKDWSFLDFIGQIGSQFSVNNMLRAECFKSRMEHGLSFLEFSYMLMQGFDFWHLNKSFGCILEIGGDDQWSNILAGIDLIHKKEGKEVFGMTLPLLTTSSGQKMGKTEKGAVWLDKNKTSIFDFFQFWRNLPDEDIIKCFKLLTFLSIEEINKISFSNAQEINIAKKKLAIEMTKIVHGEEEANRALKQAEALFEQQNISEISAIEISDNVPVLDLLKNIGFCKSKTDARNLINNRGISINDKTLDSPLLIISKSEFGSDFIIKKGKKSFKRLIIREIDAQT